MTIQINGTINNSTLASIEELLIGTSLILAAVPGQSYIEVLTEPTPEGSSLTYIEFAKHALEVIEALEGA